MPYSEIRYRFYSVYGFSDLETTLHLIYGRVSTKAALRKEAFQNEHNVTRA